MKEIAISSPKYGRHIVLLDDFEFSRRITKPQGEDMNHATGLVRFIRVMNEKYCVECAALLGEGGGIAEQKEWLIRIELLANMIRFAEKCKEDEPKQPATKILEGFANRDVLRSFETDNNFSVTLYKLSHNDCIPATLSFQLPEADNG